MGKEVKAWYVITQKENTFEGTVIYDWDNDGFIRVVSVARRGELLTTSNEDEWQTNSLQISEKENSFSCILKLELSDQREIE